MCTKNGAAFLPQQLESVERQTHTDWTLHVSDDDSTDDTIRILGEFAKGLRQAAIVRSGPCRGACSNFLSLATDPQIAADFFAFSDQDDIWHKDKLRRALGWLVTVPADVPGLYCGRTELISATARSYGLSPLFTRPPTFRNALVQNLAGGNTFVFNRAAKKLLELAGSVNVVEHDWWVYQLVSAADGMIHYDREPMVKYRQHSHNSIGSNLGWYARLVRLRMILSGRFRTWNDINIAALRQLPASVVRPKNREDLELFAKARAAPLLDRLKHLRNSGVYRQTVAGNLGLLCAAILNKL
jgi:glycosyltransferase involved in cell wall biosynthesis